MSSIITNQSAMVALDTLKGINKSLSGVQNEISTGKSINNAADNAAIWSISTVMETDVASFEQISNSLNLGSATVGVGRQSAEDIVGYLQEAKELIIGAQESNVDREKIQTDLDELVSQIDSTVNAAQFNGQNLLSSNGDITVLSSLDRASDGTVTASNISVSRQNLTQDAATTGTISSGTAGFATFSSVDASGGAEDDATFASIQTVAAGEAEGNVYSFTLGGNDFTYTASATDDQDSIATGIAAAIAANLPANITDAKASGGTVTFDLASGTAAASSVTQTEVTEAGGALEGIADLDVTTDAGAASALTDIEAFLNSAIDAAAELGSKQGRIDNQIDFVSSLTDSLKTGISTLTDANLEEASARLQALQVQQQLGVQALSIANQAPQALLGLFR